MSCFSISKRFQTKVWPQIRREVLSDLRVRCIRREVQPALVRDVFEWNAQPDMALLHRLHEQAKDAGANTVLLDLAKASLHHNVEPVGFFTGRRRSIGA